MEITDLLAFSAEQLLAIEPKESEQVFSFDEATCRREWRALSRHWHPDRNVDRQANWVFAHLQSLYQSACDRRAGGIWEAAGCLALHATDGRRFRLRYAKRHDLDIGRVYIGRYVLAYVIDDVYADLAARAYDLIARLPFADAAMRTQMLPYLPQPVAMVRTSSAQVLVVKKTADFVPLGDLLEHLGGALAPRHVAWVVSALLNLCCYLEAVGLAHQAIGIDYLLVSPEKHAISLAGGWWYASPQATPMHALPARSARLAPPDVLHAKLADIRLDQFLLRSTALELMGDRVSETPTPMLDFLTLPPAPTVLRDYEQWQHTLWQSFGERRFTPLTVTPDDIYEMAS